jgi:DNA polymerase-3 subunit delta'
MLIGVELIMSKDKKLFLFTFGNGLFLKALPPHSIMFFKEIIGQQQLKDRLILTVRENRVSHAWLFFGPEGAGALPMALAFAGYILCTNREDKDACGKCASCNKSGKYIHPDMHFVIPVNRSQSVDKDNVTTDDYIADWRNFMIRNPYGRLNQWFEFIDLENKQGIINTEESKRLSNKLSLKSFESDYKVVVIWQPEKMNDQAANKLLKLLEEPPDMTIFFLVTENPDLLLGTIKSRCMPVKVPRIKDTEMLDYLVGIKEVEQHAATEIMRLAEGNILKVQEIISDNGVANYNFTKFRDLMRSCFKGNIPELIKHAEELAGNTREKLKSFLEYGLRTVRESMAIHFNHDEIVFITGEERGFTPNFAPYINGNNVIRITDEITRALQDIERNGNVRIILLDMSLKLAALIRK